MCLVASVVEALPKVTLIFEKSVQSKGNSLARNASKTVLFSQKITKFEVLQHPDPSLIIHFASLWFSFLRPNQKLPVRVYTSAAHLGSNALRYNSCASLSALRPSAALAVAHVLLKLYTAYGQITEHFPEETTRETEAKEKRREDAAQAGAP